MGGLLHLVQRGGDWTGPQRSALLVVPNVTAHQSTASVPITVLLYNGPFALRFLCAHRVKFARWQHSAMGYGPRFDELFTC